MNEFDAVLGIRKLEYRGAFQEVITFANTLPSAIAKRPVVALERARALMRQGRMKDARKCLRAVDLNEASTGERLIIALESASLHIYCDAAIHMALAESAEAFTAVDGANIDPAERAVAQRIHSRILLIAAIYREIDAETARQARDGLPQIADTLERAGHVDEALVARLTWADRLNDSEAQLDALNEFVKHAAAANRFDLAGEARVNRASIMLANGASSAAINAELDAAATAYEKAEHVHGLTDVRRVRAKLAVEREMAPTDKLLACLETYRRVDFPRGAISLLLDLSQLAHERGNIADAVSYRRQSLEIAEEAGMGLIHEIHQLALAELLMRSNDYGAAIELCLAAISTSRLTFMAASYKQLLSSAYSFVGERELTLNYGRLALADFELIGAFDSASVAALKLAADIIVTRSDDAFDEAEGFLREWLVRDEGRADFAAIVSKLDQIAQIYLQKFSFSPTRLGEAALLNEAEKIIARAEKLAQNLQSREAARRIGGLRQLRGQLEQGRGNIDGVKQAWQEAYAIYDRAGLAMEAANCKFMLGIIHLNLSNQDLLLNFGEAESSLRDALIYYDQAGMRAQAADARYMLALLYKNSALQVQSELSAQMLDAAIADLAEGEVDYDKLRRDYAIGSVLDRQQGKQSFMAKSRRIYELALQIHTVIRPDPESAWLWTQRSKARVLGDAMGNGSIMPARISTTIEMHPSSLALLNRERELAARMEKAGPEDKMALRAELRQLRELMRRDQKLSDYLELRTGAALEMNDLEEMMSPDTIAGRSWVCVDWISVEDRLLMIVLRHEQQPQVRLLPLTLSKVRAFISDRLIRQRIRTTLIQRHELLRELDPLITPLRDLSHSEELLLLAPTGPLYALPLHALEIDGEPLLARNPLAYTPGFGVLRQCLMRRRDAVSKRTAAIFGDPNDNLSEAEKLVKDLAQKFNVKPLLGPEVTNKAFSEAIVGRDIIHFQGHAEYNHNDPLKSRLILAGEDKLKARDIFALPGLQAELVTLAACESAVNEIATGDDPLGLIPAFLYAGARSVLATLWPVHQSSTAQVMSRFYEPLVESTTTIEKAQALREAVLDIRCRQKFESPYHWAPFVLYGDWR